MHKAIFSVIFTVVFAGSAMADFAGVGTGFAIPDLPDDPFMDGTSSTIVASLGVDEIITDVAVTLTIDHTWVGDLKVALTGPGGMVDLMWLTGDRTDVLNDSFGDSSDLGATYTFADGGADWWAAAAAIGDSDIIAGGTYAPATVNGAVESMSAAFGGTTVNGLWTLFIVDTAGPDFGTLSSWSLDVTSEPVAVVPEPVPAPGAALLAVLGFPMIGWAKRRFA